MAESKRQQQVGSLVKRNISVVIRDEGSYIYGDILVTVTNVIMSPDLGLAKIYLSVFGTENKQAVILALEDNQRMLRQQLAKRIKKHVRRIPDIAFYLDDTLDEMYRLRKVFGKLHEEKMMGEEE